LLDFRGPDSDQNSAAQRNVGDMPKSESHCSIEAFKQRLGALDIGHVESFGKPFINGHQKDRGLKGACVQNEP
jgi:hypothetical protein